jgi:L-lactate dehydrogenase complex protein LldF
MQLQSQDFKRRAAAAIHDVELQAALSRAGGGFVDSRAKVVELMPEFEQLRETGKEIKSHVLENLDYYLERYEEQVTRHGGQVHWARTAEDACRIALEICRKAGAKAVTKGKSMVSEEVGLNEVLEAEGLEVIETDLGEYILQLAHEPPSHIIAPAIHKTKDQISDLFLASHAKYGLTERLTEVSALVNEARGIMRDNFIKADVGITGANFLIAETGSNVIVTNEGNGDLTCTLARVHIVTAGIEKVVPTLEDATALLRLLGRSATGQEITSYTTFSTGPRRQGDLDGPEEYHVILVDNGRSEMLGSEFREMLRCIRCGACMNHCPVYGAVGGHAYGWVYPGPMGSVLTPWIVGLDKAADLPNACTLNGRCASVCPVKIPLPDLLRKHRIRQHETHLDARKARWAIKLWAFFAKRPALYHALVGFDVKIGGLLGRRKGRFRRLPLAGGWTRERDLPAPQGETFQSAWRKQSRRRSQEIEPT